MLEYIGFRLTMAIAGVHSLRDQLRRDEGQTLVEYALILVTIAIAVTGAMVFLSEEIDALFRRIGSGLNP